MDQCHVLIFQDGSFELKYNFVETPRKFIIAKRSIRKLGSSSVLIKLYFDLIYYIKYSAL